VKGLLADVNIQGQVDLLVAFMQAEPWKLFWDHLQLQYFISPTWASRRTHSIPWCGKRVKKGN
jgi:hypothetical protein